MPVYSWLWVLTQAQHCGRPKAVSVVLWLMLADVEEPNYEHMLRLSWSSDKSLEKIAEITEIGNYLINVPKARVEP